MNENVLMREQIDDIKKCGRFLAEALYTVRDSVKAGVTTKKLDEIAEKELRKRNTKPAFLNYFVEGSGHYPASLCVSINDEIVHGIPTHERYIEEGDIVSLDLGTEYKGVFTDMALTVMVGKVVDDIRHLNKITEEALHLGIKEAKTGNTIGDIGNTIENFVSANNLEVIRDYVGHGIGTRPHMWPQIPNFGQRGKGPLIVEGMALAIEPMVTIGSSETKLGKNQWTVSTRNGQIASHFEHTVIIENGRPVIVTTVE